MDESGQHEDRLLQAFVQGDRASLGQLFDRHRDYLKRLVTFRMDDALRGRVDPSDIVQETQLVATRRIDDFLQRRPMSFRLWLRLEVMNQLVNHRRYHVDAQRRAVRRECHLSDVSSLLIAKSLLSKSPSKVLERRETMESVQEAMLELSENDREILLLRFVEQLTNAEVAELLQLDPGTSRKRHGRALRRLYQALVKRGLVEAI